MQTNSLLHALYFNIIIRCNTKQQLISIFSPFVFGVGLLRVYMFKQMTALEPCAATIHHMMFWLFVCFKVHGKV